MAATQPHKRAASAAGAGASADGLVETRAGFKFRVRELDMARAGEYERVLQLWQEGFAEMTPPFYYSSIQNKGLLLFTAALSAALYFKAGWPKTALLTFLLPTLYYIPSLGLPFMYKAMWLGIGFQTKQNMLPGNIVQSWLHSRATFLVAEDEKGRVMGCIAVRQCHTLRTKDLLTNSGQEASIWRLSVCPTLRKSGLGRLLVDKAEQWALGKGCSHISLLTGNPESQKFYFRLGYAVESFDRAFGFLHEGRGSARRQGELQAPSRGGLLFWIREKLLQRRLRRRGILVKKLGEQEQ